MFFNRWPGFMGLLISMTTIAAAEVHRDVEYSQAEGMSLRLDASIPEGDGPFPTAIVVHGGGWVRGDRWLDVAPLFKPLLDAGIAWFSISYRLATGARRDSDLIRSIDGRFVGWPSI